MQVDFLLDAESVMTFPDDTGIRQAGELAHAEVLDGAARASWLAPRTSTCVIQLVLKLPSRLEYHDLMSLFEFLDNGDGEITLTLGS